MELTHSSQFITSEENTPNWQPIEYKHVISYLHPRVDELCKDFSQIEDPIERRTAFMSLDQVCEIVEDLLFQKFKKGLRSEEEYEYFIAHISQVAIPLLEKWKKIAARDMELNKGKLKESEISVGSLAVEVMKMKREIAEKIEGALLAGQEIPSSETQQKQTPTRKKNKKRLLKAA